jgi:hypothetical protein
MSPSLQAARWEALADLHRLLEALESNSMTILDGGQDVTNREASKLRLAIDTLFPPPTSFQTHVTVQPRPDQEP